jgi:hypothetical protein
MPAFESFAKYLSNNPLVPKTVIDEGKYKKVYTLEQYHDALLSLFNKEVAGTEPKQQMLELISMEWRKRFVALAKELYKDLNKTKPWLVTGAKEGTGIVTTRFGACLAEAYNAANAKLLEATRVKASDYFGGRKRRTTFGEITITISETAWTQIRINSGNPEQILGILAQDPIDFRLVGNFMGERCIKPEPYGWIFSTSCVLRLVDPTTSTTERPIRALNFTTTRRGH